MIRIAVVDDEKNVRLALKTALEKEQFLVTLYQDGQDAFNALSSESVLNADLYILDIMMPVMDGLTFFRKLKKRFPRVPVIFLTSRDEEFDRVLGLELGADDYLCKPFSMRELIARIHVLLRRYEISEKAEQKSNADTGEILSCGDVFLQLDSYNASLAGVPLDVTVTEFRLLAAFVAHPDLVLTRDQLISAAYPDDTYLNDRAVDCHIKRLRKKIGADKIETVYGLGYRFPLYTGV